MPTIVAASTAAEGVVKGAEAACQRLLQLRDRGKYCDVTLQVGDQLFKAHRSILAAASPVFEALLFGKMREATENVVTIQCTDAVVFKKLVDYCYSGMVSHLFQSFLSSSHLLATLLSHSVQTL